MKKLTIIVASLVTVALTAQAKPKSSKSKISSKTSQTKMMVKRTVKSQTISDLDFMPKKGQVVGQSQFTTSEQMLRSSTVDLEAVRVRRAIEQKMKFGITDTFALEAGAQLVFAGEDRSTTTSDDADKALNSFSLTVKKKIPFTKADKMNLIGQATIQPKVSKKESGHGQIGVMFNNNVTTRDQIKAGLNVHTFSGDEVITDHKEVVFSTGYQRYFTPSVFARGELSYVNSSSFDFTGTGGATTLSPVNHTAHSIAMGYNAPKKNLSFLVSYNWSHASTDINVVGIDTISSQLTKNALNMSVGYTF